MMPGKNAPAYSLTTDPPPGWRGRTGGAALGTGGWQRAVCPHGQTATDFAFGICLMGTPIHPVSLNIENLNTYPSLPELLFVLIIYFKKINIKHYN